MNFKDFYHKTQNRLKDAVISLWASGDAEMQGYFSEILDKEGLLSEPVFQTAFPWEPAPVTFGETNTIFSDEFINKLSAVKSEDFRFPKERQPYKHQVESWDTLINQAKSIAVTTGTGSGKTECFMLPVLYDIYRNHKNSTGINAIFLYPLNALIGSQKKRVDAWCRSLGGIRYAVYNGGTKNSVQPADANAKLPELISREQIRKNPPQILFTNPAMLEYMLVRNKDVELLKNSEGSLRWILLDEAHTLTGSGAAEMALLIRRIVDAFKTDISKLRFAITSATAGNTPESQVQLKAFMGDLCGISADQIKVISGTRVLSPELEEHHLPGSFQQVQQLRKDILAKPALSLAEIGQRFGASNLDDRLDLVDTLSEQRIGGRSILPVRGHFFARGIGGVFVCTNPECSNYQAKKPTTALGHMTTIAGGICKCGSQLLELVACRSCDNHLLEGEKLTDRQSGQDSIRMVTAVMQDPFAIDNTDEEEDVRPVTNTTKFYFTRNFPQGGFMSDVFTFSMSPEGRISFQDGQFTAHGGGLSCPHCGEQINNPQHFRLSSSFINRILADIILEITPEAETQTQNMLWKGHKYISFTDSRQGTAKISALINQDNEGNWVRSQVYHRLCDQKQRYRTAHPAIPQEDLEAIIASLEEDLIAITIPVLRQRRLKELEEYKAQRNTNGENVPALSLSWEKIKNDLGLLGDFNKLFKGNNPGDKGASAKNDYLTAILYDQFARRLPKKRSLENLGMVNLVYSRLNQAKMPAEVAALGITPAEWPSLLKIAADYVIRSGFHFTVPNSVYTYGTEFIRSAPIYNPDTQLTEVRKWPVFDRKHAKPNRLALLICAGLGYRDRSEIDHQTEDEINELMEALWRTLKTHLLRPDGDGYKMNLEEEAHFQLATKLWLCPVKKRLIDSQFRGYSPWIKGSLSADNLSRYQIEKEVDFPEFPHAFNRNDENNPDLEQTRRWIAEKSLPLRKDGVWNNLLEQVILDRPLYLSGEHSAQQNENRLLDLERQFEASEINILNCSTTMEMGVDIGGISAVVMNNVPPSPANYLQRAGRAGRRSEAQSLSFTICSPNPVGLNAWVNPKWALTHPIAPPYLSFKSDTVVMRHINAFFLGKFVQTDAIRGLNLTIDTGRFFFRQAAPIATLFSAWMLGTDVHRYEENLQTIISNTPVDGRRFSYLLNQTMNSFQQLLEETVRQQEAFEEKAARLLEDFGKESPALKAVQFQQRQFLGKNAITYLAEEGFLPSAGLPTGIVAFDTLSIDDLKKNKDNVSKPSYFITRALSEFAPGNQVVIDGKSYVSAGISLKNERGVEAEREIIQSCRRCGYQRILKVAGTESLNSTCPHCGENDFVGISFKDPSLTGSFTEMIQPAGFAVDLYEEPTRKISEASSAQYVDPLLINVKPWQQAGAAIFDARESDENADILFYNVGRGNGYSVCLHCGRASADPGDLVAHTRLRGGRNNDRSSLCSGNNAPHAIHHHVILGGKFQTDFSEIRFKEQNGNFSRDESLLYTLGAILTKELAHFLAVEQAEISFGVKRYAEFSSVFIFDSAKGGAGYASQFPLYADELFKISKQSLSACDCDQACTKCLIDRNTQWHMDKLDRKPALAWLSRATGIQVPADVLEAYPGAKRLSGEIKAELGRLADAGKIKEISLFGSADFPNWNLEKIQLIEKLRNKAGIHFVLDTKGATQTTADKIFLIRLSALADCREQTQTPATLLKTICQVITKDNELITYLATDFAENFDENWGATPGESAYSYKGGQPATSNKIEVSIDEQSIFEARLDDRGPVASNTLADLLLAKLKGQFDIKAAMQGQAFDITYYDRYLKTPLGCILTVQFLSRLREKLGFSINSFTFKGQDFTGDRIPYHLFHDFENAADRNQTLEEFAGDAGISSARAANDQLPHYRYFEFTGEHLKITIRPDAGIAHGWFLGGRYKPFNDGTRATEILEINKKDDYPLLYTVSVERC